MMYEILTPRLTQSFGNRFNIASHLLTEKKQGSPEKPLKVERRVIYHLGEMCRRFQSGAPKEVDVGNADVTHFCH